MKVLMFSTDSSVLVPGSEARERMRAYSDIVEQIHVIVLNKLPSGVSVVDGEKKDCRIRVGRRLVLYPTNSITKTGAFVSALKIGSAVLPSKHSPRKHWLITAQNPFAVGLLGLILAKMRGIALELQLHTDTESNFFKKESFGNMARAATARFLLPHADGVRAVSERLAKPIRLRTKRTPEIMPVFVDIGVLRSQPLVKDIKKKYPQFDFLILIVSRLSREKNIPTALRAIAEIVKKYPQTGLIIVGDGPERKRLKLQVASYKLQANVIFEGWRDDIISYYRSTDVYLLTSLYEGYGRTLIEAAALGCPIISSDVGVVGEILLPNENALVCAPQDVECFARNILRVREDEHLRRALSVQAEQAVNGIEITREEYLKNCSRIWRALLKLKVES